MLAFLMTKFPTSQPGRIRALGAPFHGTTAREILEDYAGSYARWPEVLKPGNRAEQGTVLPSEALDADGIESW